MNNKISTGGYREKSGRSKNGYYKGVYCASTYELVWVIYRLDHNLPVERFPSSLIMDNGRRYYPDFIDNNIVYEIKGYIADPEIQILKEKAVIDAGFEYKILFKGDLTQYFKWVENKYNTKTYHKLYDNHKPKYEYYCSHCEIKYFSDRKIKTNMKFCTNICSGKFRKKQNNTPEVREKIRTAAKCQSNRFNGKRNIKHIWINNDVVETRIIYDSEIPINWKKGRLKKYS